MNKVKCKLSELVEVKNGSTPSTAREDFYEGDIVWITPKDLSNNKSKYVYNSERRITKAGFDSCSTSLLPIGSVLLSSRAPIGLLAICAIETCTNQGFKNLVIKKNKINNEYLYYWLKTKVKYIDSLGTGTTFKEVSKGVIENLEIELPENIKDQQKIASVLSALDSKIELNNRINAELEAMAKTLYDYWFVQFDFPDKNGKPYKTSGGKMIWNEELKREIPEGWEVCKVHDYAEIKKGELITAKDAEQGNVKVVAAGVDYSYLHSTPNRLKNTITISGSGANAGYINFWREPIFASDCITVRGKNDSETLILLQYLNFIQPHILSQATGSAQPHVYPSDIKVLNYVVPPDLLIDNYGKMTIPMNEKIGNNLIENQKLTELRDWLLPMLMNGQVKVN